eukprot:scaffold152525_cov21-Prasinocladus_malaysianus.AAC.1
MLFTAADNVIIKRVSPYAAVPGAKDVVNDSREDDDKNMRSVALVSNSHHVIGPYGLLQWKSVPRIDENML